MAPLHHTFAQAASENTIRGGREGERRGDRADEEQGGRERERE